MWLLGMLAIGSVATYAFLHARPIRSAKAPASCAWSVLDDVPFTPAAGSAANYWGPQFVLLHSDLTTYVFGDLGGHGAIRWSYGQDDWASVTDKLLEDMSLMAGAPYGEHGLVVVGARRVPGGVHWSVVLRDGGNEAPFKKIDDFTMGGNYSFARAVDTNAKQDIYVTGEAADDSGRIHWVTRKLSSGRGAWSTIDDFSDSHGQDASGLFSALDESGQVGSAGIIGKREPVLRMQNGGSWKMTPLMVPASAHKVTMDSVQRGDRGDITFTGSYLSSDGKNHWIIAGSEIIDDYVDPQLPFARATSVVYVPGEHAPEEYAIGYAAPGDDPTQPGSKIVVRHKDQGGSAWKTVDEYQYRGGRPTFIGHDTTMPEQDLFTIAATAVDAGNVAHWIFIQRSCN